MATRACDTELNPASVRRYVEEHFSLEKMVDRYAALYREMTNNFPVEHAPPPFQVTTETIA